MSADKVGVIHCRLFSSSSLFIGASPLSSDRPFKPVTPQTLPPPSHLSLFSLSYNWSPTLQDFTARRFDGAACKRHQLGRAIGIQKAPPKWWWEVGGFPPASVAVRGSLEGGGGWGGGEKEEEKPSGRVLTGWIDGGVEVAGKGFCYANGRPLCSRELGDETGAHSCLLDTEWVDFIILLPPRGAGAVRGFRRWWVRTRGETQRGRCEWERSRFHWTVNTSLHQLVIMKSYRQVQRIRNFSLTVGSLFSQGFSI